MRSGSRRCPKFDSLEDERQHRKERLAAGFRLFAKFGFEEGVAGHITARDPIEPDTFWVNPFGVPFAHVNVSSLIRVNHTGEVVEGNYHVNEAAFCIHSQVHAARPDVVAAAHSHSTYGRALSALGELLEPITQDVCAFYDDHALFDDYTGVVTDIEEGKRIARRPRREQGGHPAQPRPADRGHDGRRGVWWFITMERSCQVQLLAKAAGKVVHIDPDQAKKTHEYGRLGARRLVLLPAAVGEDRREQPDLFD